MDDSVEVRVVGGDDATPSAFLWRNRLYVVRTVIDHWHERGDWWAGAAARAVHGDAEGGPASVAVLDQEREFWRVEASPGRDFGSGVYDLAREATGWRLVRVVD